MPVEFPVGQVVIWWKRGVTPVYGKVLSATSKRVKLAVAELVEDLTDPAMTKVRQVERKYLQKPEDPPGGTATYDALEELPYMIEEVLTLHPGLVRTWLALLAEDVEISVCDATDGCYECTIRLPHADVQSFRAANEANAAIWGAMRDAYSKLTGRQAPMDDTAVFSDYELD
jgi:hypothetical protein